MITRLLCTLILCAGLAASTRAVDASAPRDEPGGSRASSPSRATASGYLRTNGGHLVDARGHAVRLTGINWFGLETCTFSPHGLWVRNWKSILTQIKRLGFNTVRLPFASQLLDPGSQPINIDYGLNPGLKGLSGLQLMDRIIARAGKLGLKVILDRHRPDCGAQSPLWYTDRYSEARWIGDWVTIAARYANESAVIGTDLHNEPHAPATWGDGNPATDWRLAAERAGNAILRVNPKWLIFVQGIDRVGTSDFYWWGGNLAGAGSAPVRLAVPHRLVYETHDYGPEIFDQKWFDDPTFPRNLPVVWSQHWGYLQQQGIAPVLVGEFGGRQVDAGKEGAWIHALVKYLHRFHISYAFWALNPDSGDTGGLLEDDWKTVDPAKIALLRGDQAPLVGAGRTLREAAIPVAKVATGRRTVRSVARNVRLHVERLKASTPQTGLEVLYSDGRPDLGSNNPSPNLRIVNDGPTPVSLSDLEARYYLTAESLRGQSQILDVDWASMGADNVQGDFVHLRGTAFYLRLRFSSGAGQLAAHGGSAEIKMRIHKPDWSNYDQADDFSFGTSSSYVEWLRVPLFIQSRLIWGRLPPAA
jgi:endoglucanase